MNQALTKISILSIFVALLALTNCSRSKRVSLGAVDINPNPSTLIIYSKKNKSNFNIIETNILRIKKAILKKRIQIFTANYNTNIFNSSQAKLMILVRAKGKLLNKTIASLNDNVMNQFFTRQAIFKYYSSDVALSQNKKQLLLVLEKRRKSFSRLTVEKKLSSIQKENQNLINNDFLTSIYGLLFLPNNQFQSGKIISGNSEIQNSKLLLSGNYFKTTNKISQISILNFEVFK